MMLAEPPQTTIMHVCLLETLPGTPALATIDKARLLLEAGLEVSVVASPRAAKTLENLPSECTRLIAPRATASLRRHREWASFLKLAMSVKADYYHAHSQIKTMGLARFVALIRRGCFYGDFNNIIIHSTRTEHSETSDRANTFDFEEHWQREPSANELQRIEATMQLIPEKVFSALDVGCGDGRITNRLTSCIDDVIGLDQANAALGFLKPPVRPMLGSADDLPLENRSVDLVLATEVIEHLPEILFQQSLNEMERVARKYILLGVPFEEQLANKDIVCPVDGRRFNVNGHLHTFSRRGLGNLMKDFRLVQLVECGAPTQFYYHPLLMFIRQRLGGIWARPPHTICPECGINLCPTDLRERNAISKWCDEKNLKIRAKRTLGRSHALALYEREQA